jgi:CSLREA domain-containing protein
LLAASALVAGTLIATPLGARPVAAAGRTFTVTSTGDAGDTNEGDGACNAGGGQCTLRAAIEEANAWQGHDTIEFDIAGSGPHTIRPGGDGLEWITSPDGVTIDGYSQPGSRANTATYGTNAVIKIQIEGQGTDDGAPDGLELRSRGNVVRGLAIYDFRLQVRLFGGASTDNVVVGNFVGTNAAATVVNNSGNSSNGVHIQAGPVRAT